ncbi:hypothetical protein B0T25DRAFT_205566 [Lasiosphaeria hispida]|uniref:Extracellular membrane protein CFEM domain-containing protein n=1 Tax=Lasiosphaeria hispida TaxID=260671 RepID=A0AAJ0HIA4_9PEZI|nr:hypothetical protein B0T25DRAFT_205566 [Lasiosphaeria hispida]
MRDTALSSLLAALASLFLLAAASPSRPECLQTHSRELAASASCGNEGSLNYCFSHLSPESATASELLTAELERCFVSAGCTLAESQIEAFWTLQLCDGDSASNPDLRRRRTHQNPEAAIPLPRAAGITLAPRQETTAAPAPDATAPPSPTTKPASPSPCFTETLVSINSCPLQETGPDAGKRLPCFPTVAPSSVCAADLICQVDGQGNPSCMYRQSRLDLSGIIIAVFFASAVFISVCSICFFCCREQRVQRRLTRAAEAAKIAAEAKTQALVAAKRGNSSPDAADRQPLMADAPPVPGMPRGYAAGGAGGYQDHGADEFHRGQQQQNPFVDDERDAHPLR